jgi:thiol-disulfide isomerase/thioredoxin
MKKNIIVLIAVGVILAMLGGCGQTNKVAVLSNGVYVNSLYNSEDMTDISGDAFVLKNNNLAYAAGTMGFGFTYTDEMIRINSQGKMCVVLDQPYAVSLTYITEKSAALYQGSADTEAMSEEGMEDLWQNIAQTAFAYAGVFRCPGDDASVEAAYTDWVQSYDYIEIICEYENDLYVLGYNTDYADLELTADEQTDLAALIADRENFKSNLCIFRRESPAAGEPLTFKAKTLDSETVTEDIFKDYKLTMVNIWATYCAPCIEEMPELQKLYEQLPDGVNLVTVVVDGAEDPELVKEIYDSAKGTFMVIFPDEGLEEGLLDAYNTVPTTVFVDKDGNIVGKAQIGAPAQVGKGKLVDAYLDLINDRLQSVE